MPTHHLRSQSSLSLYNYTQTPIFFPLILLTIQIPFKKKTSSVFQMGSVKFSLSSNVLPSMAAGSMDFQSNSRKAARSVRLKPSFKVMSSATAQVSGAETQAVAAGGHMKKPKTLYDVMGLSRGASPQDIKAAYRKLARQFHPDAAVSAEEKSLSTQMFLQIGNAYAVLSKPEERAQYDRQLIVQQRQSWSGRAYQKPAGHVGRNWETDQCW